MDEVLANALKSAKAVPRSSSKAPHRFAVVASASRQKAAIKEHRTNARFLRKKGDEIHRTSKSRGIKTIHQKDLICSFCGAEKAAVFLKKNLSNNSIPLCLVHYYSTRFCRIDPHKVTLLPNSTFKEQLPYVQDLFSDAFTELQNDISTEASRTFNAMNERGPDPLSILNDHDTLHFDRRIKSRDMGKKERNEIEKLQSDDEGGFMRHVQMREKTLIKLQERIKNEKCYTKGKGKGDGHHTSEDKISKGKTNPFRRRKCSTKSVWNLILDSNEGREKEDFLNSTTVDDFTGVCTCGSYDINVIGKTTSINESVAKSEIWGIKRDNEVTTRYCCNKCGKIWNEE